VVLQQAVVMATPVMLQLVGLVAMAPMKLDGIGDARCRYLIRGISFKLQCKFGHYIV
jgi:hypothetical protein